MDVELPDGTIIKGVPDGTSKAQLATKLKANGKTVPDDWLPTTKEKEEGLGSKILHGAEEAVGSVAEPLAKMATGAIAKPVSDVAGLAATAKEAISPTPGRTGKEPQQFKEDVQRALTYDPRTTAGKSEYNPLNAIPGWLGKGVGYAGEKAGQGSEAVLNAVGLPPSISGPVASGIREGVEQIPNIAGAKLGAKAAESLPAKQAALDLEKSTNAPKDALREQVQASGYRTPPEHGVKAGLSGLAGKTKIEKLDSEHNTLNATKRLGQEVGVPEGGVLSKEEFTRLKADAGKDYAAMKDAAGPELEPTQTFRASVQQSLDKMNEALKRNPEANKPLRDPQRLYRSFLKQEKFPTESTLKDIQKQREWAKEDFRKGNKEMGQARLGLANQLENMFQDNLAKTGQQGLVDNFKAARQRFSKIYLLERITNDATGKVDLPKLATLSESKAYKGTLTGEFNTAASLAKTWRKAAQRSTGEAAPRLTVFDGMFLAAGLGGAIMGHPAAFAPAALELAGRYGIPSLAKRGMLQNTTPNYQVGAMPRSMPFAAPAAGVGIQSQVDLPPQ